ncbi:MAG: VTC domain-containing protein [Actinomycetaceae bacterium]|nr:VTC domain-containing protein [Actinomycetaceae bacterium]
MGDVRQLPAREAREQLVTEANEPSEMGAALGRLPAITLDELSAQAALLRRVDRKYLVAPALALDLVRYLGASGARVLTIDDAREFHYLSDYFDTPDFSLHRLAATKRRRRFKVRSRIYLDSGLHFAELKTRGGRGYSIKDRLQLEDVPRQVCQRMSGAEPIRGQEIIARPQVAEWVAAQLVERGIADTRRAGTRIVAGLRGSLRSVYTRSTLYIPGDCRVTIDVALTIGDPNATASFRVPGVVVETKSSGGSSRADHWLWRHGARPTRFSKYSVGVVKSNPALPTNRWHRTLNELGEMK